MPSQKNQPCQLTRTGALANGWQGLSTAYLTGLQRPRGGGCGFRGRPGPGDRCWRTGQAWFPLSGGSWPQNCTRLSSFRDDCSVWALQSHPGLPPGSQWLFHSPTVVLHVSQLVLPGHMSMACRTPLQMAWTTLCPKLRVDPYCFTFRYYL